MVKIKSRPLTVGETLMAKLVFRDSINYSSVWIHNRKFLPFGLQHNDNAMCPNGKMYFSPHSFRVDFSEETDGEKIWFIHEMVHIWQYQLGYWVKWHGLRIALSGGYIGGRVYRIDRSDCKEGKERSKASSDLHKTLPDFNMEQQAVIISEYFGARFLNDQALAYNLPFYDRVLQEFIKNPQNAALLPQP